VLLERIQNLAGGPINLLHRIAIPSIGTLAVKLLRGKERQMRKGVRQIQKERLRFITLNKLMIAVREIERATSPLAKEVKILEVTPPGAAAIIITPTANSGEIVQTFIKAKAITGSKII